MDERFETSLEIVLLASFALIVILVGFFIAQFIEMLNDHRCYTLPPQEFFSDPKCERYWDFNDKDR